MLDLSNYYPGCGLVMKDRIGKSQITLVFNKNAEEASQALDNLGRTLQAIKKKMAKAG